MTIKTIDDYAPHELARLPKSAWPIGVSPKLLDKIAKDPSILRLKYDYRCRRNGKTARKRSR